MAKPSNVYFQGGDETVFSGRNLCKSSEGMQKTDQNKISFNNDLAVKHP